MQISITFRNMEPSDALKNYARDKVQRLRKYISMPMDVHVVLGKYKYLNKVEIKVATSCVVMKSEEQTEDMYSSIDLAMDKIERQARRHKDKLVHRRPSGESAIKIRQGIVAEELASQKEGTDVVDVEEFHATPMSVDDAVKSMNSKNKDSLVFVNSQTQDVNVIYRRTDGNIGLIEAKNQDQKS